MKYKLGVIGFGVMGQAIITRFIESNKLSSDEICIFDLDLTKISAYKYKINTASDVETVIHQSERILFAVKPQHYSAICENVNFSGLKTILSIMAGVKISTLRAKTKFNGGIVRIMPNTPCALGKGVCGLMFDKVSDIDSNMIKDWFSTCGGTVVIDDEKKFDAITSVSGSGPAYVYAFAQGMIEGGLRGNLTEEESKILALNTIIGAAELAKKSNEPLDVLIDRVCSKGGTTIEAINVYRERGLTSIIADGIDACREKSKNLSEKL